MMRGRRGRLHALPSRSAATTTHQAGETDQRDGAGRSRDLVTLEGEGHVAGGAEGAVGNHAGADAEATTRILVGPVLPFVELEVPQYHWPPRRDAADFKDT